MTPLYAGIGGVVRELTEMDAGINGVVTPLTEMWAGVGGVERQIFSAGKTMGGLSVGDTVTLLDGDGFSKDFVVLHQGIPSSLYDNSCFGTWVAPIDMWYYRRWDSANSNVYETSDIYEFLSLNLLHPSIQEGVKTVKIPYHAGGGAPGEDKTGQNGLSCKFFLLSGQEVGLSTPTYYLPQDGSKLDYFLPGTSTDANNKRKWTYVGDYTSWFTRSPNIEYSKIRVNSIDATGNHNPLSNANDYAGINFCCIFDPDFPIPNI